MSRIEQCVSWADASTESDGQLGLGSVGTLATCAAWACLEGPDVGLKGELRINSGFQLGPHGSFEVGVPSPEPEVLHLSRPPRGSSCRL